MTRSSAHFARMAWLAIAAVLLMAVMPTVGRLLTANGAQIGPVLMEMCTTAGRQVLDVSLLLPRDAPSPEPDSPPMAMGALCDYCVLVAPMPLLLALLSGLLRRPPSQPSLRGRPTLPRLLRNMRGLGSQAPPITL